ncbi:hypothetical protein SLE2022_000230 [Rubroshorea leprosula]
MLTNQVYGIQLEHPWWWEEEKSELVEHLGRWSPGRPQLVKNAVESTLADCLPYPISISREEKLILVSGFRQRQIV